MTDYYGQDSLPKSIKISPSLICNLHCPLCPTGLGSMNYNAQLMDLETFRVVLSKLPASIESVSLFNLGEPFLNPDLITMIGLLKARSYTVDIHSNFSFRRDDDFFRDLIQSGLDTLIISLDGASQNTYSRYRQGGDFDLVVDNIRRLKNQCALSASPSPDIIWKLIVNKHNEFEIETAKKMAHSLGVSFVTERIGLGDDLVDYQFSSSLEKRKQDWLPTDRKYVNDFYDGHQKAHISDRICQELFTKPVVKPDGKVTCCCFITSKKNVFGDLLTDSFEDIWHNAIYSYSRSLFGSVQNSDRAPSVCEGCRNYLKAVYLSEVRSVA